MTTKKLGCSQETLKLIACITMLIDHIGSMFFPDYFIFRAIGRIAFPIYCFQLVEGVYHTSNKSKYGLRLFIGILLAEIPFDLAMYGQLTWEHQSVMVTLFLGYIMIIMCNTSAKPMRPIIIVAFMILSELLQVDYGLIGILTIVVFYITHNTTMIWTILGLTLIACLNTPQCFALLAVMPLMTYTGQKTTKSKAIQYWFYLFYPIHLLLLYLVHLMTGY